MVNKDEYIARVEANIIIRCYLFPHWLSNDTCDDDHFAHFADEYHWFYCVTYLVVFVLSSSANVVQRTQAYCFNITYKYNYTPCPEKKSLQYCMCNFNKFKGILQFTKILENFPHTLAYHYLVLT